MGAKPDTDRFYQWVDGWMESNCVMPIFIYKELLQSFLKQPTPDSLLHILCFMIKNPNKSLMLFAGRFPYTAAPRKMAFDWVHSK